MNDSFLSKMLEAGRCLLLDPVMAEHTSTAAGVCLVLGFMSFRQMAESLGASNWTMPMSLLSYALGLGAMLGGLAAADMFLLPNVPKGVPLLAYVVTVLMVMLIVVAAPIGKFLMKSGYWAIASAWVTALMVSGVVIFFADLGFTHFGPPLARVVDMKGPVSFRLAKGEPLEEMKHRRMGLPIGAEVVTKADSFVTISLGNDCFVTLGQLGLFRIVAMRESTSIELDMGRVIGSVPQTPNPKFKLRTPAASVAINGSDFSVLSDNVKQTFVTVATGKLTVASTAGGQTEVSAGQTINCPNSGSPTPPRRADAADMTSIESFKTATGDGLSRHRRRTEPTSP